MGRSVLEHICRTYINTGQRLGDPSHPAKGLGEAWGELQAEKAAGENRAEPTVAAAHPHRSCSACVDQKKMYRELPQNGTKD